MTEANFATPSLPSGTLWQRVQEQTQHALACGALQPLETDYEFIEDHGIQFLVRTLSSLKRKDQAREKARQTTSKSKKELNPFLPYEPDLFVTDISETHVCLLNKFNVIDHHLLIVTRTFEEQESLLGLQDFSAAWACLHQIHGFVFYNAGKAAGASQRHKHLQLIPLPLTPEQPGLPIQPALETATFKDEIGRLPCFPFKHGFMKFNFKDNQESLEQAQYTFKCYRQLLATVNFTQTSNQAQHDQTNAYNLLMTKQWMLLIPRSQESFHNISVNAAGFAGTLFTRNVEQIQIVKREGPIKILQGVTLP